VQDGSVLFAGTTGTTPASGAGTRLMWIPAKGAFRAGVVASTQWDDASIGTHSTVGGGYNNTASGSRSTVSGGSGNTADNYATVGGGNSNNASGGYAAIGGGDDNTASGGAATIGGGYQNAAGGFATVAGGANNNASGAYSAVGGGSNNQASGIRAMVPGGVNNLAAGNYSFAAGRRAKANHAGAFVWGDQTDADFASTAADQFLIRATGGVGIGTGAPGSQLTVKGAGTTSSTSSLNITDSGGSSLLFVRDDGNVGIGTTSPSEKLHVTGSLQFGATPGLKSVDGGFAFMSSGSNVGPTVFLVPTGSGDKSLIQLYGQSSTSDGTRLELFQDGANSTFRNQVLGGGANGSIRFDHNGTTNLIIGSDGKVGISTTSPGSRVEIKGEGNTSVTSSLAVFSSGSSPLLFVRDDGNVGIGTTSPGYKLDVNGGIVSTNNSGTVQLFNADANTAVLNGVVDAQIRTGNTPRITIKNTGNVGIGTSSPSSKLEVSGGDIRVTAGSFIDDGTALAAPDYVFEEDYSLMPLDELQRYIDQEKHLPNIPSAEDIKKHGLNLSQFQMKLLEKIEELTLYTLAQQKQIEQQQEAMATLAARLTLLEQAVQRASAAIPAQGKASWSD